MDKHIDITRLGCEIRVERVGEYIALIFEDGNEVRIVNMTVAQGETVYKGLKEVT